MLKVSERLKMPTWRNQNSGYCWLLSQLGQIQGSCQGEENEYQPRSDWGRVAQTLAGRWGWLALFGESGRLMGWSPENTEIFIIRVVGEGRKGQVNEAFEPGQQHRVRSECVGPLGTLGLGVVGPGS